MVGDDLVSDSDLTAIAHLQDEIISILELVLHCDPTLAAQGVMSRASIFDNVMAITTAVDDRIVPISAENHIIP